MRRPSVVDKGKLFPNKIKRKIEYAGMAQLVEQRIRNAQVIGSSPITSSIEKPRSIKASGAFLCVGVFNQPLRFATEHLQSLLTDLKRYFKRGDCVV